MNDNWNVCQLQTVYLCHLWLGYSAKQTIAKSALCSPASSFSLLRPFSDANDMHCIREASVRVYSLGLPLKASGPFLSRRRHACVANLKPELRASFAHLYSFASFLDLCARGAIVTASSSYSWGPGARAPVHSCEHIYICQQAYVRTYMWTDRVTYRRQPSIPRLGPACIYTACISEAHIFPAARRKWLCFIARF